MKLKKGFIIREVAGQCVVVPTESTLDFKGMIALNGTAKTLWSLLEKGAELDELTAALLAEYDVDEATAAAHVNSFVEKLKERGFLE